MAQDGDYMVEYAGLLAADLGCGGGLLFPQKAGVLLHRPRAAAGVHGLCRAGEP